MSQYFLNLNKRLISDELSNTLLEIANRKLESFIDYHGQLTNEWDGNSYLYVDEISNNPDIVRIKNSCSLYFFTVIMMHKPNVTVKKHVDDPNNRNCLIITPLAPKENYAPTRFWEKGNPNPVAVCDFSDFNSALVNTQMIHDLENCESYRFNLQFCFNEPYQVVKELYEKGELFKNTVDNNE